jgi:hypothetical protein
MSSTVDDWSSAGRHAAGIVAAICAMNDGTPPPTINYEEPDPNAIHYIPQQALKRQADFALCNSLIRFKELGAGDGRGDVMKRSIDREMMDLPPRGTAGGRSRWTSEIFQPRLGGLLVRLAGIERFLYGGRN